MTKYGLFTDIITQKEEKLEESPACPYCESRDVKIESHEQTYVGDIIGPDGEKRDSNHHWKRCVCKSCKKKFTWEHKLDNQWFTEHDSNFVLRGVSNCFESYRYTCNKCSGHVWCDHRKRDGKSPLDRHPIERLDGVDSDDEIVLLTHDRGVPQYREFWLCDDCGQEIQTDIGAEKEPYEVKSRKLKTKWSMESSVDLVSPGLIVAPWKTILKEPKIDAEDIKEMVENNPDLLSKYQGALDDKDQTKTEEAGEDRAE